MVSFIVTLMRLLQGIARSFRNRDFQVLLVLIVLMLLSGTLFYRNEEGLSTLDALYFCVSTLSTVGDSGFRPATALGKIFTMVYIVVGTGIFLGLMFYIARGVLNRKDGEDRGKKS